MNFGKAFKSAVAGTGLAMATLPAAPAEAQYFPPSSVNGIVCEMNPYNGILFACFNDVVVVPQPSAPIACVNSYGTPVFTKPPGYNAIRNYHHCQF